MLKFRKEVVWIVRGRQRRILFLKLPGQFVPNSLRKHVNADLPKSLSLREVSRHLRDFEKRKLLNCLNASDPYNKVYVLTDKGGKVQEIVSKLEF